MLCDIVEPHKSKYRIIKKKIIKEKEEGGPMIGRIKAREEECVGVQSRVKSKRT